MKKLLIFLLIFMTFIGIDNVKAVEFESIDYSGLYCYYLNESTNEEYHLVITADYKELKWEFDGGGDSPFPELQLNMPSGSFQDKENTDYFIKYGLFSIKDNKYYWDCPTDSSVLGISGLTLMTKGCYEGDCNTTLVPSVYETYTCNYTNPTNKKTLTINFESNETNPSGKWNITYPDGTSKTLTDTQANGNMLPNRNCNDIYYVPSTKQIKVAIGANEGVTNNVTLGGLCDNHSTSQIEHYCSGKCSYQEMNCSDVYNTISGGTRTVSCGGVEGIPYALPKFISNIIDIIKVATPIILIIMGMIDFAKATVSNDEKNMKESQKRFIRRVIGGIVVFLVVVIIQLIFNLLGTKNTSEMASCINCFVNNVCIPVFSNTDDNNDNSNVACYQCNDPSNLYEWSEGSVKGCSSGTHIRNDIKTAEDCHS